MKNFFKSIGLCLGVLILNQIISILVVSIGAIFNPDEISKYLYTLVFIGDVVSLILLHFIYAVHDKKLLSKEVFNKVDFKNIIYIALLGIGLSVLLLNLAGILTKFVPSYMDTQDQIKTASNSILQLLITIILIPICEEILFRRVMFGYLKEHNNIVFAVILQALVFGLAHGNLVQGIYTFVLGIVLALVYMYCNSLWGCITLHIVFNCMGLLIVPKLTAISPIFGYAIFVIGLGCLVFSLLKLSKKYEHVLYE